jgi:4-amino-4-deoxy-L-arabinose transferase-like glycosyltransferase
MHLELDTVLKRTILVFAIIGLVLIVFVAKFENIIDPNVADYAQIARHVASGEGFVTSAVSPLSLSVVPRIEDHPELSRPPLYICFLALVMLIGGATDKFVALTAMFFFLATLLLTYIIARRCFSDQVGIFAVLITLLSVPLLQHAISGPDTTLLTFLVTLLFGTLFWREKSDKMDAIRWPIASGIVLGLCYLTRYEAAALVPAVLFYYWMTDRKPAWRRIGLVMLCFVIVIAPWIIRSSILAGTPFVSVHSYELVMFTDFHPMQTMYRTFSDVTSSPWLEALRHPLDMMKKFNEGLQVLYRSVSQLANPFVMPFFIVGVILGATRRRCSLLQWSLLLAIILQVILLCIYMPMSRLLLVFTPMVAILAAAWFATLVDDYLRAGLAIDMAPFTERPRFLALIGWTIIVGYPLTSYIFTSPAAREHPIVAVCQELGEDNSKLIASDIPWFIAWYGEKTALLIPQNERELSSLNQENIQPDAIYLSPTIVQMPPTEEMQYWQNIFVRGEDFRAFRRNGEWRRGGGLWTRTE